MSEDKTRSSNPRKKLGDTFHPELIKKNMERKIPWNGITRMSARAISMFMDCIKDRKKKPVINLNNRLCNFITLIQIEHLL
ncbi:MAG: hypothetical protein AMS27_01000 [Bacteroides sp. SM23_62_1]|nr:MAG: hypothetical protein AMS27_01000 [Bacteroides sp. SM23_62_1]